MLFPKSKEVVNLDDQISGRQDYLHKFKRSFYIIGNSFFSTNHLGDYNQEEFIRKTGYKSQRYPQKVILALSLMGYITNLFRSYSVGHHGYQYEVDYWKFKKWDKEFFVDVSLTGKRKIHVKSLITETNGCIGNRLTRSTLWGWMKFSFPI